MRRPGCHDDERTTKEEAVRRPGCHEEKPATKWWKWYWHEASRGWRRRPRRPPGLRHQPTQEDAEPERQDADHEAPCRCRRDPLWVEDPWAEQTEKQPERKEQQQEAQEHAQHEQAQQQAEQQQAGQQQQETQQQQAQNQYDHSVDVYDLPDHIWQYPPGLVLPEPRVGARVGLPLDEMGWLDTTAPSKTPGGEQQSSAWRSSC